jgi:membrane-associated protease RseP (regulator of RpoE activity)
VVTTPGGAIYQFDIPDRHSNLHKMPKEIVQLQLKRGSTSEPWGFKIIGGKDQSLTVKIGSVKPYSNAEAAGLKVMDYVWEINGKEVFEMSHDQCVAEVKNAGTTLTLATERGDHIVPNFEEIWPSKKTKDGKVKRPTHGIEYYLDAMENGPDLSGYLPIPPNFTTVGKPQITVNQYDNPIDVYSDDTLEEMKEERLVMQNPEVVDRMAQGPKKPDTQTLSGRAFDPRKSTVLAAINA